MILLFVYDDYYPEGGAHDLYGSYDSVKHAFAELPPADCMSNAHAYDLTKNRIVAVWRHSSAGTDPLDLDDYSWESESLDDG